MSPDVPFWAAGQSQGVSNIKHSFPHLLALSTLRLLLSFSRQKETGSELRCGQTKDFLQLAAYSVQGSGTHFRCLGKPSVALEAMKLGWERSAFWPLCFQLERPLRKPISQHFLQNCLHPSHLVFSSDGGLPETSLKLRKELPDFPPERRGWLVCSRWIRNACFMPAVSGQGTLAWGLSWGTNVSSLGGETDGLSRFYQ